MPLCAPADPPSPARLQLVIGVCLRAPVLVPTDMTSTLIGGLLAVTYHLPVGFWTSLLLKLYDLAAHRAQSTAQDAEGQQVCVLWR
ncbi:hypothetical protein WMY93_017589 [Mugilogobius chulae]|uniref:Pecanex-like protein n=1 Tax=Mugilogobius chulae TaxID=88201 RepID=A0AAW0NZS4_9GOBI